MWQCIIKSSRPRTAVPPLLFGLGIECDHVFGSKLNGLQMSCIDLVSPFYILR